MTVHDLLALEQAMHDVAVLYTSACSFAALKEEAEKRLRPELTALSSQLRAATRAARTSQGSLGATQLEAFAKQILALHQGWTARIEAERQGPNYRSALVALNQRHWETLEHLLPRVFSDLAPAPQDTVVFLPLDASRPRARNTRPFRSPGECAAWIEELLRQGIVPDEGDTWWTQDFPYLQAAAEAECLAVPLWLQAPRPSVDAAVLLDRSAPGVVRIYGRLVRARWAVGIAETTEDEWWLSQNDSLASYRQALLRELEHRKIPVASTCSA